MDLSNLSNHLPPTSPITDESIEQLSNEITANFKDAAKSVAALYRLSQSKSSLLINKGYLDCLDDILKIMSNGEDVENWVLLRRNELVNMNKNKSSMTQMPAPMKSGMRNSEDDEEEEDENTIALPKLDPSPSTAKSADFKVNNVSPAPFKFPPSMVPLSMNYSNIQYPSKETRKKHPHIHHGQRKNEAGNSADEFHDDEEEEEYYDEEEVGSPEDRRGNLFAGGNVKRRTPLHHVSAKKAKLE